ncbi:1121_t:CDS:2, partial [Ambispora leptoticha]
HDKNILVHDGRLMITDFGLSKSLDNSTKSIDGGTCAFSDPQYLQSPFVYKRDKASDIYSLGVLFWELSSGVPPFKNIPDQREIALLVISGKRETPISGTPVDFINIYCDSWNDDPNLRPNIVEIREKLNYMRMIPVYNSKQDDNDHSDFVSSDLSNADNNDNYIQDMNSTVFSQGYSKLLEIKPNNASALLGRGTTYHMMNRYEKSQADLNKSLEINPNNVFTLANHGKAYFMVSRYADLNKSLEINSNNASALAFRGVSYRMINRYADLNKSLEINSNNAVASNGREAIALWHRGATHHIMDICEESQSTSRNQSSPRTPPKLHRHVTYCNARTDQQK